jgi:hypothetical protein
MRRSSRPSESGFADTAGGNPFAVFEIIADVRKIRRQTSASEIIESANRIEQHADGMVKRILGTADLSTLDVPDSVIEQIVETLRSYRQ